MGKGNRMNYDALRDYISTSELRIVNDNFRMRMAPAIAAKYDSGAYKTAIDEHTSCINELSKLNLQDVLGKKPIFYTYLVPDNRLIELLNYPYQRKRGGRPVMCFDSDGFISAYGATQNTFVMLEKPSVMLHVNHIHEYAHLFQQQLNPYKHVMFHEGFAEVIPWYILDYESKCPEHVMAVVDTDVYCANDLLTNVDFRDVVEGRSCSFQKSYISSYVFIRTLVEQIQSKFGIDKTAAVKMYMKIYAESKNDKQWLVVDFAKKLGLDADKLLYTTEYQKETLQKMKTTNKIQVKTKEIDR